MGVESVHPSYSKNLDSWQRVRAALEGDKAIKDGGVKYLPAEFAIEDPERYETYKNRSYFIPATSQAHSSMLGMVFRKSAMTDLPEGIEVLSSNIDNSGNSLEQFAKTAVGEVDSVGRFLILADYPEASNPDGTKITREQARNQNLRPFLAAYYAEDFINWRTQTIDGNEVLVLAVLRELVDVSEDEFSHEFQYQYRVLRLTDGVYTQQLHETNGQALEIRTPLQGDGTPFDHIPLHIAGSEDNRVSIDTPPLLGLSLLNIAHYQTTADHRENLFIHGQLTLGITSDLTNEQFKEANPDGVKVGARRGHFLGENGQFHTVTAPESSSLRVALQDLETQMIAIGARLIRRGGQAETAEAVRTQTSAESSILDNVVTNTSEAIKNALMDMARFLGVGPDGIEYMLNRDYFDSSVSLEMVNSITGLIDRRIISRNDGRDMIRRASVEIGDDRTDEEIDQDIASEILNEDLPDPQESL